MRWLLAKNDVKQINDVSSSIIREIVIPELEKEVNEGKNFANLRQIYNSMILATWYKRAFKESILGKVYVDQERVEGLETKDQSVNDQIYHRYLEAFEKGAYSYIKEDYDETTQEMIARKYFSGGVALDPAEIFDKQRTITGIEVKGNVVETSVELVPHGVVNGYIRDNLPTDLIGNTKNIQNYPLVQNFGVQARIIPINGLLASMGQLAHIGLGQVYGQPVIYIDTEFAENDLVQSHELFEIAKWESKRKELGLTPDYMRQWILDNLEEANVLARQWHEEAPSIKDLLKIAQSKGLLSAIGDVRQIYTPERDVNLAAGNSGRKILTLDDIQLTRSYLINS